MDTSKLDDMSKFHAELFLKAYPDWEEYFSAEPYGEDSLLYGDEYLLIRVPSPTRSADRELIIEGFDEISVYFGHWHTHIMSVPGDSDEDYFNQAKQLIDSIINEEIIVGVVMDDGKWAGSRTYTREEVAGIKITQDPDVEWLDEIRLPKEGEALIPGASFTYSWRGTFDSRIEHQPKSNGFERENSAFSRLVRLVKSWIR